MRRVELEVRRNQALLAAEWIHTLDAVCIDYYCAIAKKFLNIFMIIPAPYR